MMILDSDTLREARKHLGLSQMEAAELLEVSLVTYQRWEQGKARPQPFHLRQLRLKFRPGFQALGLIEAESRDQGNFTPDQADETVCASVVSPLLSSTIPSADGSMTDMDESRAFLTSNMTMHLLHIAYNDLPSNDKPGRVRQAIEEFDSMNSTNKNYQITRREALCSLATLPMVSLGLTTPDSIAVQPSQYGTALAHCSASLEACWGLACSRDAHNVHLAFECASKYFTVLTDMVSHSSQYRQTAADLAARYAIIKVIAGWHCEGFLPLAFYAADAVKYGKEAGNDSLLLSAYGKLAWAHFYNKKYASALLTAQEAQSFLEQTKMPLPDVIIGGTYSTLALMQTKNHQDADQALGKAAEIDPGDEVVDFMEFTRLDRPCEIALTYIYRNDTTKAISTLGLLFDPDTLENNVTGRRRGDIDSTMALAMLNAKGRDIDKVITLWTRLITEARAWQSEGDYEHAISLYDLMQVAWPGEKRILELRDLIQHW